MIQLRFSFLSLIISFPAGYRLNGITIPLKKKVGCLIIPLKSIWNTGIGLNIPVTKILINCFNFWVWHKVATIFMRRNTGTVLKGKKECAGFMGRYRWIKKKKEKSSEKMERKIILKVKGIIKWWRKIRVWGKIRTSWGVIYKGDTEIGSGEKV